MADTVSTQTLTDTTGVKFAVKMTNFSDGTGETLVKKVDASATTFMTEDGNRKISKIFYLMMPLLRLMLVHLEKLDEQREWVLFLFLHRTLLHEAIVRVQQRYQTTLIF